MKQKTTEKIIFNVLLIMVALGIFIITISSLLYDQPPEHLMMVSSILLLGFPALVVFTAITSPKTKKAERE